MQEDVASAQALDAGCLIERRSTTTRKVSRGPFRGVPAARRQPPTQIPGRATKKRIRGNLASGATQALVRRGTAAPADWRGKSASESGAACGQSRSGNWSSARIVRVLELLRVDFGDDPIGCGFG